MREILFRGKFIDDWTYGDLHLYNSKVYIIDGCTHKQVKRKTVGQYTGLEDKNGQKVFEGDILQTNIRAFNSYVPMVGLATFKNGAFGIVDDRKEFTPFASFINTTFEVIGNIHDNPELIGEGAE